MTIPTAPPPAADATDPAASATRRPPPPFRAIFLWVSGLGVARSDGWLGGVAAGIAARLRIDPLIVRGVLVIAALFGLPVIFLYAVAWALLPDADGRIHARDLLNRDYEPVQLGILAMAAIETPIPTAPLTGRLFGLGYESWSALSVFSWIVGLILVGDALPHRARCADPGRLSVERVGGSDRLRGPGCIRDPRRFGYRRGRGCDNSDRLLRRRGLRLPPVPHGFTVPRE